MIKMRSSNTLRVILTLILLLLISSLSFQSKGALLDTTSFTLDFEDSLEHWETYRVTSGSELALEVYPAEDDILGNKSVKLIDNSIYRFRFNKTGVTLQMTNETHITFQWMFESTSGGAYAGFRLYTYDFGSLHIHAYFQGYFVNTSYAGILQIYGEETNVWHSHTVDLNEAYMQVFGEIPAVIDFIDVINYPIGGGSNPTGQITYFDNIVIANITVEPSTIPPTTTLNFSLYGSFILVTVIAFYVINKKRKSCRM